MVKNRQDYLHINITYFYSMNLFDAATPDGSPDLNLAFLITFKDY